MLLRGQYSFYHWDISLSHQIADEKLCVVDYSMVLLVEGGKLANTNTYQGLVNTAFGRTGFLVLTAMQFLYPFIGKYNN